MSEAIARLVDSVFDPSLHPAAIAALIALEVLVLGALPAVLAVHLRNVPWALGSLIGIAAVRVALGRWWEVALVVAIGGYLAVRPRPETPATEDAPDAAARRRDRLRSGESRLDALRDSGSGVRDDAEP